MQGNTIRRSDQVYRQDGPRLANLENPYSSVNMPPSISSQQYDPRFVPGMNPAMNLPAGVSYNMVSNSYGDGMKNMQIPYDRGVFSYGMPMPMINMQAGGYAPVNPFYGFYGMRQGMTMPVVDRSAMNAYPQEFVNRGAQEKLPSAIQNPVLSSKTVPSTQPMAPSGEDGSQVKQTNFPSTEDTANPKPAENASRLPVKQLPVESAPVPHQDKVAPKEVPDKTTDLQLATILLQIKGKGKDVPAKTPLPPPVSVNPSALPNPMQSAPGLPEDKRQRIGEPLDPALQRNMYSNLYPQSSSVSQKRNYPVMNYASQFQAPSAPAPAHPAPAPSQPHPPPIPSPAPAYRSSQAMNIGDYYVYCTVCRHGTPIAVNKPIPDVFKCSNCGFSCALDKHLLYYYVRGGRWRDV